MTSYVSLRGHLGLAIRLIVLVGTSYFLIATSAPYEPYPIQRCSHASETLTFRVTGTCGQEGNITVTSLDSECAIAVGGGAAVGLPSAGRFDSVEGGVVSLAKGSWTLSGYLPEAAIPAGLSPQPDAGIFTVASPDAGVFTVVGPDAGVFTVVGSDAGSLTVVRDAQSGTDLGVATDSSGSVSPSSVPGQHATPALRTCTYQPSAVAPTLRCTGGTPSSCKAVLNSL